MTSKQQQQGTSNSPPSTTTSSSSSTGESSLVITNVAVIGIGWWSQGWHLPHLKANAPCGVKIAALVDPTSKPTSTLASSPLLSLDDLSKKYDCPYFSTVSDLLNSDIGPRLDGAIVATSHAAHYGVGVALLNEGIRRRKESEQEKDEQQQGKRRKVFHRVINILMEKPFTTDVEEAQKLYELSTNEYPEGSFVINHTASYRPQTKIAQHLITSNEIGEIHHIVAKMNGPLMWLFDDPKNHSWVSLKAKDGRIEKSGYAWGQIAHILAWIYTVLGLRSRNKGNSEKLVATPVKVYCDMGSSPKTDADVSVAAVIMCHDGVTFSLSGTALLPGSQFTDSPIGKHISIDIFGNKGSLMYGGDDRVPDSGRLELRKNACNTKEDGQPQFPCSNQKLSDVLNDEDASDLKDGFYFEECELDGLGPKSMKEFLDACKRTSSYCWYGNGAQEVPRLAVNDSLIGLRTVQIIDAMYRSSRSGAAERIK